MSDTSAIVESKRIYTSTLLTLLQPPIYLFIKRLWNECKDSPTPFKDFQNRCYSVRSWNSQQIKDFNTFVTSQLEKNPDFDLVYFSKLLHVIFKLSIKILNIVNDLTVTSISLPSNKRFFYQCIVNACKQFYNSPFVFETNHKLGVSNHQLHVNINQRKQLVSTAIVDTVQHFLPIKKILCDPENLLVIHTEPAQHTHSPVASECSIQLLHEPIDPPSPTPSEQPDEKPIYVNLV